MLVPAPIIGGQAGTQQERDVAQRVTGGDGLPVDHRDLTGRSEQDVVDPEVAVDQGGIVQRGDQPLAGLTDEPVDRCR